MALLATVGVAYAAGLFGTVTSTVNITPTATPASLAITAVTDTAGGSCSGPGATWTCTGASVGQGGSFTYTVTVTNSGGTAGSVAAATCASSLLNACTLTSPTLPAPVAAGGGTVALTFTYVAGQTTGPDTVTIQVSA